MVKSNDKNITLSGVYSIPVPTLVRDLMGSHKTIDITSYSVQVLEHITSFGLKTLVSNAVSGETARTKREFLDDCMTAYEGENPGLDDDARATVREQARKELDGQFKSGTAPAGYGLTPEQAKGQIENLLRDFAKGKLPSTRSGKFDPEVFLVASAVYKAGHPSEPFDGLDQSDKEARLRFWLAEDEQNQAKVDAIVEKRMNDLMQGVL